MDTKKTTVKKEVSQRAVDFIAYLEKEHGLPVSSAYLFGSHARGTTHKWSDVDVCVISPLFKTEDPLMYLWTRRRRIDVDNSIEPVGFTQEEFDAKIPSPLVAEIRAYGEELPIR
ncbi:MAG: polymerase, beta domain protein region protein [Parcubacteria group bacterium GW2011_GWA2_47_16]|nr:MAG: polymerase, beta domain protein region protein [Parcubacteria group bacterium GW2011_GWA2_47_16]